MAVAFQSEYTKHTNSRLDARKLSGRGAVNGFLYKIFGAQGKHDRWPGLIDTGDLAAPLTKEAVTKQTRTLSIPSTISLLREKAIRGVVSSFVEGDSHAFIKLEGDAPHEKRTIAADMLRKAGIEHAGQPFTLVVQELMSNGQPEWRTIMRPLRSGTNLSTGAGWTPRRLHPNLDRSKFATTDNPGAGST